MDWQIKKMVCDSWSIVMVQVSKTHRWLVYCNQKQVFATEGFELLTDAKKAVEDFMEEQRKIAEARMAATEEPVQWDDPPA